MQEGEKGSHAVLKGIGQSQRCHADSPRAKNLDRLPPLAYFVLNHMCGLLDVFLNKLVCHLALLLFLLKAIDWMT